MQRLRQSKSTISGSALGNLAIVQFLSKKVIVVIPLFSPRTGAGDFIQSLSCSGDIASARRSIHPGCVKSSQWIPEKLLGMSTFSIITGMMNFSPSGRSSRCLRAYLISLQ